MFESLIKKKININLFKVISKIADESNLECFIIGGYVRDLVMGKSEPKDVDILVVGDGIEIAKKVCAKLSPKKEVKIYKNFRTAAFKYKNIDLEFVGSRKESYISSSRNPQVEIGTLQDDLNRRDFTINSIGISLNLKTWGKVLDNFNGLNDIYKKLIITPLDPIKTFSDDPLRMMRAAYFASKLNFKLDSECRAAITNQSDRISIVSWERIREELIKTLSTSKPSVGLVIMQKTGLLKTVFPEIPSKSLVKLI